MLSEPWSRCLSSRLAESPLKTIAEQPLGQGLHPWHPRRIPALAGTNLLVCRGRAEPSRSHRCSLWALKPGAPFPGSLSRYYALPRDILQP